MRNFKNVKQIVKNLLIENRLLADSDKDLCWAVWIEYSEKYGIINMLGIDYNRYKLLPSESSITRARRQIEQFNPELRGNTYNERKHKKEPQVKEEIQNEKWNDIQEINKNRKLKNNN